MPRLPFRTKAEVDAKVDALAQFTDDLSHALKDPDKRYEFVFNEVRHALDQQAAVLDNIRARTNVLLSTATVAVTFVVSLGLLTKDTKPLPVWADVLLIGVLVGIGLCAFGILWPRGGWSFSIGPRITIEDYIEGTGPTAQNINIMYRKLALYLWARWEANGTKLDKLFLRFQIGSGLLVAGVLILILGLLWR